MTDDDRTVFWLALWSVYNEAAFPDQANYAPCPVCRLSGCERHKIQPKQQEHCHGQRVSVK